MTKTKLRREIKKAVDRVPLERLKSLADYVQYLSRPSLLERIEKAEKDIAEGKGVSWRTVRRDV
jgi:predicted transcriptional regulator